MRRKIAPDDLAAIEAAIDSQKSGWQTHECKLVTPLYGGGVEPGKIDEEMPIRASEIRGQLRFWWRIACAQGQPPKEMLAREASIWGGMEKAPLASKVEVRLSEVSRPTLAKAHLYKPNPQKQGELRPFPEIATWAEGYALFPAQGKLDRDKRDFEISPKELAREGLRFHLHLRLDDALNERQRAEVQTALRWWASFGGLGARTRRGLGAVWVEGLDPVLPEEVASRAGLLKLLPIHGNPTEMWKKSVARLKAFRQGPKIARNEPAKDSKSPGGRSLWPEADALRALSNRADPRHVQPLVHGEVFPRAAFGLPIVFHFKDRNDPPDHVLEPADPSVEEKRERMASPLILRPYWNGASWQPAALLLPGWEKALRQPLKFKDRNYTPARWPDDPSQRKRLANGIKPMTGRGDDPLSAFMNFFAEGK